MTAAADGGWSAHSGGGGECGELRGVYKGELCVSGNGKSSTSSENEGVRSLNLGLNLIWKWWGGGFNGDMACDLFSLLLCQWWWGNTIVWGNF